MPTSSRRADTGASARRTARAVRIDAPYAPVAQVSYDVAPPGRGEVLVRSAAVGICGSDIDLIEGSRPEAFSRYPVVPGHEWSGTVVETGPEVTGWTPGDRVVCAGMLHCGHCVRCAEGRPNLCLAGYDELGFTRAGGFAEHVLVPDTQLHRLPDGVALDAAALLEPTAVVAHGLLRAGPVNGRRAAVVGDGALGQLAAQLLRLDGAAHVTLHGLVDARLSTALRCGADEAVIATTIRPRDLGASDLVVETGGSASSVELALELVRPGGTVVLTGISGGAPLGVSGDLFVVKDLQLIGVLGSTTASWQHAVALATRLELGALVTHRFPLARAAEAFATARERGPDTLKVLVLHEPGS